MRANKVGWRGLAACVLVTGVLVAALAPPAGAAPPPLALGPSPIAPSSLAQAGTQPFNTPAPTGTPKGAPAPPTAPAQPAPMQNQPLTISAGTGVLLHLNQPVATVLSADPAIARVQPASPTSLFLMGVSPGETTVIATNQAGSPIVQYNIRVTRGAGRPAAPGRHVFGAQASTGAGRVTVAEARAAQASIEQSVTGAQGVRVRAAGTDMILSGTVPNPAAAQAAEAIARAFVGDKATVIDQLLVLGSIQVNVRVRIAEISRQITRQLGFNWQALGSGNGWRFGLRTGVAAASTISPLLPLGLPPLQNAVSGPYQVGAGFTSGNGAWDANNIIDALAEDQLITILAEPNLTAQSGETASFLAGGEFPIPVAASTSGGATQISVQFKEYGVSLALVPTVLSATRLNLRIRPEVSQLTSVGAVSVPIAGGTLSIPALTVRRAETTVELGSGQSFAIAGLLRRTSTNVTSALPGLGELPVLGALFKSNNFQRGESELVIIITPYIVRPASGPQALRAPTDHFRPATDLDRILFGRQIARTNDGSSVDAGFILK